MPLQATSGAASYDAFGGGVPVVPNYIEEVFSTYLYTGNSATQTITNGIDLSGKGGLVWTKARVDRYHNLEDTVRGAGNSLWSNASSANYYYSDAITSFGSTGYTLGADGTGNQVNSSANYVSWTFRKQPKFFDVVTYTGNGGVQNIAHNLGSVPGCFIVKRTDSTGDWYVNHRSFDETGYLKLNSTDPADASSSLWDSTYPTSTQFTLGNTIANTSGATYVAYLFAHNAGGFGLTGTDNVISCGSYIGNGGVLNIDLGFEPQWLLVKRANQTGGPWMMVDNMRGAPVLPSYANYFRANSSDAEVVNAAGFHINSTGFNVDGFNFDGAFNGEYIYIAIRRGPMKVPTSGTSVFTTRVATEVEYNNTADYGITTDLLLNRYYKDGSQYTMSFDRLRGSSKILYTPLTDAEGSLTLGAGNLGFGAGQTSVTWAQIANSSVSNVTWAFRRAPSTFDVVCYTGTGYSSSQTLTHNLSVIPELMIAKDRTTGGAWGVYSVTLGATKYLQLNEAFAEDTSQFYWGNTAPTSTQFTVKGGTNIASDNYVIYLFATCAGVSKVGSYTGNGSSQTINCGFTGGARFVMVKATSTTGNWIVADSARGIVSGNDPYLELNTTNAEVTGEDWLDTDSTGFVVNEVSGSNANTNGVTYIYLAIA